VLDIDKISKDIKAIFDKHTYKRGRKPINLNNLIDKDISNYIRVIHNEIKDLAFPERCLEINKIYKVINDLKKDKIK
jgi:hypothetical protein